MKAIAAALVKAQQAFGPALKTHSNPAFRSKYADLSACIEAVIDGLNSNGIFLMQPAHECADGVTVETVFIHESGEQISAGKLHVPAVKQDPQGYGSALTYARRYSLMAACGIAPEDDDGNAARRPEPKRQDDKPLDMSPKARAGRITDGVKAGDAEGAAAAMAGWDDDLRNSVWSFLTPATQAKLEAAWPKEPA